ncbi:hypothetical protein I4U23_005755 [Adineta vaga]|nr:hypothetical protein I4U23_005755 [Adineta vaga]
MNSYIGTSQQAKSFSAFICLTLVQILTAIVYKLSQRGNQYDYSPASAVVIAELLKLFISFIIISVNTNSSNETDETSCDTPMSNFERECEDKLSENLHTGATLNSSPSYLTPFHKVRFALGILRRQITRKLALHSAALGLLYCVNNQLSFTMYQSIDVATISLFKTLSSPFAALILWGACNRSIGRLGWTALLLQVVGLGIVQYNPCIQSTNLGESHYAMLITAATITAVCSVYNEQCIKILKADLQTQNIVLYSFGVIFNLIVFHTAAYRVSSFSRSLSFFAGYSWWVVGVIACNSVVGLAVTAVYKYSDAIMKTWASACATAALLLCNRLLFHIVASAQMYAGATVVFAASYVYILAQKDLPLSSASTTTQNPTIT